MLCLYIENFLIAVHIREEPRLGGLPVAVVEAAGRRLVLQAGKEAAHAGVACGMSRVQALAACADLICVEADVKLYGRAHDALLTRLTQIAPRVEASAPGLAYLETRGLGKIYGRMGTLVAKVLDAAGAESYPQGAAGARTGVARSKLVARFAAMYGNGLSVPPACEKSFLGALPIGVLEPDDGLREQLFLLGIHTLGQFAQLEPAAVAARYGPEGCRLHRMARGIDDEVFRPWKPVPEWVEQVECELPVSEVERLLFLLSMPLEGLLARLEAEGLACQELAVTLQVEDSVSTTRRLPLAVASAAAPAVAARMFLELLRLDVERTRLSGPVTRIALEVAAAAAPHAEQGRLFGRQPVQAPAIAQAVAKLAARLGPDAVFSPELVNTWRPENAYRRVACRPQTDADDGRQSTGSGAKSRLRRRKPKAEILKSPVEGRGAPPGLRLFAAPQPAGVRERDGRPERIFWMGQETRVLSSSGPWSLSGEWFAGGYSRDYHEIETSTGHRLWLFRDRVTGDWFVHGTFG